MFGRYREGVEKGSERDRFLASDAERGRVAAWLGVALEEGRINLAEYERRTQAAYAAPTRSDLESLTVDLPRPAEAELERRMEVEAANRRDPSPWPVDRRAALALVIGLMAGGLCVAASGSIWPLVLLLVAVGVVGGLGWTFWDPFGHRGRRD